MDSQGDVFHTFNLEDLIPAGHPLRAVKRRADRVLATMSRDFNAAYGRTGRPGIPVERLLKAIVRLLNALLLRALYSIRSEIQLCEPIAYNLLFRWFLDLQPSERVWTPEVFSMNRARFEEHGFVGTFFDRINREAILEGLADREGFTVDGALIESYASLKRLSQNPLPLVFAAKSTSTSPSISPPEPIQSAFDHGSGIATRVCGRSIRPTPRSATRPTMRMPAIRL